MSSNSLVPSVVCLEARDVPSGLLDQLLPPSPTTLLGDALAGGVVAVIEDAFKPDFFPSNPPTIPTAVPYYTD